MKKLSGPIEIIKKSVNIFTKKENFLFLIQVYIPMAFFSLVSVVRSLINVPKSLLNSPWFIGGNIIIQLLSVFVGVFISAAGIIAVGKIVDGANFSVREVFINAKKGYWKYLLILVLVSSGTVLGTVLLIVPGVLFSTWYIFARFIFIENKNVGVLRSLGKSKNLVKGKFWKVLGRVAVFGLFSALAQIILSLVPVLGSIAVSLFRALFVLPTYLLYKELAE